MENEADEDYELDRMVEEYKKKGGEIIGDSKKNKESLKTEYKSSDDDDDDDEDEASDADSGIDFQPKNKNAKAAAGVKAGFEIVAKDDGR